MTRQIFGSWEQLAKRTFVNGLANEFDGFNVQGNLCPLMFWDIVQHLALVIK